MMERPTRDTVLMETALQWAGRSTCSRLKVGAVASRDGRILVQGYNGAPAGLPHCDHRCTCKVKMKPGQHHWSCNSEKPCDTAVHAEMNIVSWAARHGVKLEEAEIHCTDSPCLNCAMAVVNSGIKRFVYKRRYRVLDGVELMNKAGIEVVDYANLDW